MDTVDEQLIKVHTKPYHSLYEEYVDTCLQPSNITVRLRDIYDKYVSWLKDTHIDEYTTLVILHNIPTGAYKSGELALKECIEQYYPSGITRVLVNRRGDFDTGSNMKYRVCYTFNISVT